MDIKPIETVYKGYRFRSRLEARWAVFFERFGLKWEYEPEGFKTSAGWYLPDFRLVNVPVFMWDPLPTLYAEVKPAGSADWGKAEALAFPWKTSTDFSNPAHRGENVLCLEGEPDDLEREGWIVPKLRRLLLNRSAESDWQGSDAWGEEKIQFHPAGGSLWTSNAWRPRRRCSLRMPASVLHQATCAARSARFEHGEAPL